jgi:hypothetical protein
MVTYQNGSIYIMSIKMSNKEIKFSYLISVSYQFPTFRLPELTIKGETCTDVN